MASIITAQTLTISANGTTNIAGAETWTGFPVEIMIRPASSGVFLGNSSVSSTNGYELNANQEYRFRFEPPPTLVTTSSENQLHLKNSNASSVTVSYAIFPSRH